MQNPCTIILVKCDLLCGRAVSFRLIQYEFLGFSIIVVIFMKVVPLELKMEKDGSGGCKSGDHMQNR